MTHRSSKLDGLALFSVPMLLGRPRRSFDASGRALPLTPEEIDQRAALALQALDSLEDMGDEEEQQKEASRTLPARSMKIGCPIGRGSVHEARLSRYRTSQDLRKIPRV